jgi:hypothetical protein
MVTEEDLRRVALSLPGSAEKPYNRLPSFRVRGNLFIRIRTPDAFLSAAPTSKNATSCSRPSLSSFLSRPITPAIRRSWYGSARLTSAR